MTDHERKHDRHAMPGDGVMDGAHAAPIAPRLGNGGGGDTAKGGNGRDPNAGESTAETQKAMLKEALRYAGHGMHVFPAPPGTKKSYKCAEFSNGHPWGKTNNASEIKRDWKTWPDANVCIATGPESGYFVLEVDTPQGHDVDGFASLKALEAIHGPLPETRQAISPSGSVHRYFKWPATGTIRNSASLIGPGIDIRGEGGMVVAPPSLKPGVGAYKWQNEHPAVDMPDAWLALIVDTTREAERTPGEMQANLGLVAAALAVIFNDEKTHWEEWNRVGMATWAATGGHKLGFDAFNAWSKKGVKYNERTTREKWKAYTESTPITSIGAGSIFYLASEANPDWREQYEATLENAKPIIEIEAGCFDEIATRAEELLIESGEELYEFSGTLVRPIVKITDAAKKRKTVTVQLEPLEPVFLRRRLNRHINFKKFNEKKNKWVKCNPPAEIAEAILKNKGCWKCKEIVAVTSTQTMREDGSLLLKAGYDKDTKILVVSPPPIPDDIPEHPTRADAEHALAKLEDLLIEFKFVDDGGVSYAVALSGLITPVVRAAFDVAPMHMARAPVMSSGKSYLWDVSATISNGYRMPVMSTGADEAETEKRLGAALLAGQPLVSIDNISGELKSDALCQIIERPTVDIRILGRSERVRIETRGTTIFCTGNNAIIVGDLTRRVITAGLDPQMERPELRVYQFNPVDKVQSDRGAYIAACLTICRAYIVAGRPCKAKPLSSFEGWSDTVRSALIWLGKADPVDSLDAARAEDPELNILRDLLVAWATTIGMGYEKRVTTAKVIEMIEEIDGRSKPKHPELTTAIQPLGGTSIYPVTAQKLGFWLRFKTGRVVDDLRFLSKRAGGHTAW